MLQSAVIKNNKDFLALYNRGKIVVSPHVVIYVRKNRTGLKRLGITAGKKVGGAVERNRAKRVIRAAYREVLPLLPDGIDMVIVARAAILSISSTELAEFLKGQGLRRINRCLNANTGGKK